MQTTTAKHAFLPALVCLLAVGCSPVHRPEVRQQSVPIQPSQVTQQITITGNVIAATTAPAAAMNMTHIQDPGSNLGVTWSWSLSSADYGSDLVPANYAVGLFIWNKASGTWHPFKVVAGGAAATWAQRIQDAHDTYPTGQLEEPASRIFESGRWCVTLGAAKTGSVFLQAPNAKESCATVPARAMKRRK